MKKGHLRQWMKDNRGISALLGCCMMILAGAIVVAGVQVYRVLTPRTLFDLPTAIPAAVVTQTPAPTPPPTPTPSPTPQPTYTPAPTASPTPSPTPAPTPVPTPNWDSFANTSRLNILIMGLDGSPERGEGYNSDTILLASLDLDHNRVDVISIPRDSYVPIYPEGYYNKVNSAYGKGGGVYKDGFLYARKTVQSLMGVQIHHYVGFNMPLVKEVINIMGGVWYDVELEIKMAGRVIEPGYQKLDGQQVLDYCRFRGTPQADIGRIGRQQKMLMAIFGQLMDAGQITNIPDIYQSVAQNVYTDLSVEQIVSISLFAATLPRENIGMHMVPGQGMGITSLGYWGIDNEKFKQMHDGIFGINFQPDPMTDREAAYLRIEAAIAQYKERKTEIDAVVKQANDYANDKERFSDQIRSELRTYLREYKAAVQYNDCVTALIYFEKIDAWVNLYAPPVTPSPAPTPVPGNLTPFDLMPSPTPEPSPMPSEH